MRGKERGGEWKRRGEGEEGVRGGWEEEREGGEGDMGRGVRGREEMEAKDRKRKGR